MASRHDREQVEYTLDTAGWKILDKSFQEEIKLLNERWYKVTSEEREEMAVERRGIEKFYNMITHHTQLID